MTNTIKLKKSSVAGKVPAAGDLVYGELALNYSDGRLYYKTDANGINYIANGGTFTNALNISATTQSASTITGALTVAGGAGIGGNLYVGGTIYGAIAGTVVNVVSTATQVYSQRQTNNSNYYLTFVDSDNESVSGESLYTTSSFVVNPGTGNVGIGTLPSAKLHVSANPGTIAQFSGGTDSSIILGFAGVVGLSDPATNNGYLFRPSANYAFIQTSGSERVRVDSIGNVGIGTSTPAQVLEVRGWGRFGKAGNDAGIEFESGYGKIYRATASGNIIIDPQVNTIFLNGNVGVGTTSTNSKLDVNGTARFSGITTVTNTTSATSTATGALQVAGGVGIGGSLYVGGEIVAQKLTIQYTTVTTTLVVTDDIIQTTNTTDTASTTTGALVVAGGVGIGASLYVGGTTSTFLGKVGIGSTLSPTNPLEVRRSDQSVLALVKDSGGRTVLQLGTGTNVGWAVIGGSDYNNNIQRLDISAGQIYFNGSVYANGGNIIMGRVGDALGTSTQKNSYAVAFQNSFWNGSSAVSGNGWQIVSVASTTENAKSKLSFQSTQDASAERVAITSDGIVNITTSTPTSSTSTGALQVAGGIGVGLGGYFGGTVTATNFVGNLTGSASQVNTVQQATSATYYPTFVDANNASATGENLYTTSSFVVNPSTGNVGIGTSSPSAKLHVIATGGSTTASNTALILDFESDTASLAGGGTAIEFRGKSSGGNLPNYSQARIRSVSYDSNNSHGLAFDYKVNADTALTEAMRIDNTGDVGIGTGSPTFKVDTSLGTVNGNTTNYGYNIFADAAGSTGYSGYNLQLNNSTANATGFIRLARTASTLFLGMEIQSQSRDGIRFLTSATTPAEVVRINADGNVGIGTASPSAKLHVNTVAGTIAQFTGGTDSVVVFGSGGIVGLSDPAGTNGYLFRPSSNYAYVQTNGQERMRIDSTGSVGVGITSLVQKFEVAGNVSLRNNSTATNLYVHNTYTDGSNYERAKIGWNSNVLEIAAEYAGTGAKRTIKILPGTESPALENISISQYLVGFGGYAGAPAIRINNPIVTQPAYSFVNDGDTGLYSYAANSIGFANSGTNTLYVDTTGIVLSSTKSISFFGTATMSAESATVASVSQTQISAFSTASFRSAKLIVQAYDTVTGEVQISELLVAHNGTTASATEYGVVYTGTASIVTYEVDINTGNVRLLATRSTANSTQYKISETLMSA